VLTHAEQPRAQFLLLGYYFALLLTTCQSVKLASRRASDEHLADLVRLTTSILNLAMDTADSRTQHLTDHIYHIITFSAITLCRLLGLYEGRISLTHDITALDDLVSRLVDWLKSIGLRCHVAHMLGNVVASQQRKLRPNTHPTPMSSTSIDALPFDTNMLYPEFINAEMFDINTEGFWPSWN
jgi:hypothetical protein